MAGRESGFSFGGNHVLLDTLIQSSGILKVSIIPESLPYVPTPRPETYFSITMRICGFLTLTSLAHFAALILASPFVSSTPTLLAARSRPTCQNAPGTVAGTQVIPHVACEDAPHPISLRRASSMTDKHAVSQRTSFTLFLNGDHNISRNPSPLHPGDPMVRSRH